MAGKCPKSFQHLILNGLKITLHLIKVFKKNYNEKSEVGYILDVNVKYHKKIYKSHNEFPFLPERRKLKKMRSLQFICMRKLNKLSYKKLKIRAKPWPSSEKSPYDYQF